MGTVRWGTPACTALCSSVITCVAWTSQSGVPWSEVVFRSVNGLWAVGWERLGSHLEFRLEGAGVPGCEDGQGGEYVA